MNVLDLLKGQLNDDVIGQLSQVIGATGKSEQTKAATSGIVSTLLGALAKNATSSDGLQGLMGALDNDHDGSILDDVMGLLQGNRQVQNQRMTNGSGILKHILGDQRQGQASQMISKMSGLNEQETSGLMEQLAPLVMGALGRAKREEGLQADQLSQMLSQTVQSEAQSNNEMSIIQKFIDQDGDGSVMDDLINMGGGLLGNLLKR